MKSTPEIISGILTSIRASDQTIRDVMEQQREFLTRVAAIGSFISDILDDYEPTRVPIDDPDIKSVSLRRTPEVPVNVNGEEVRLRLSDEYELVPVGQVEVVAELRMDGVAIQLVTEESDRNLFHFTVAGGILDFSGKYLRPGTEGEAGLRDAKTLIETIQAGL